MSALDWVFVVILVGSVLIGALRGLVFEVLSLISWVLAFFAARLWGAEVGMWLPMQEMDEGVRIAAGLVIVFVVAIFALGLVIRIIGKLVQIVGLRPFDRTLGALFGALRGVLLLVLIALVFMLTSMRESQIWNTSVFAPHLVSAVSVLRPWMPQEMGRHWSSLVDQLTEAGSRIAAEPR
ncbi:MULTISPECIES: CvpA family protein [Comamonas]|jgi:membrane protein required for colicin V production|uniref:CvpA family protein n=1 Tax=Comamonas squillarum TaxID=2977320 RepID=A0ABY6A485_9BURK|nr:MULTISPECIES: CvpA family protein [Comamonas]PWB21058.1 colicin V synthesis protein [Comamonas sp. JNW]UXC19740.1 CvpA family protein [Comamonas sp. PR12]